MDRGSIRPVAQANFAVQGVNQWSQCAPCGPAMSSCPDSEVRTPLRRPLMRTSESKGYEQLYDSSAPFEPEVRYRFCSTMRANFGFGALARIAEWATNMRQ